MSDYISRQAAIDALRNNRMLPLGDHPAYNRAMRDGENVICNLPSAQQEQPSEIQDIFNYLDTVLHPIISPEHWDVYSDLHDMISTLPSVQPKRGKWILDRSGAYCCSECMEPCATYVMMKPRDRFCKMCGADMR